MKTENRAKTPRRDRRHRVLSLPTGPSDPRGPETLIQAEPAACLRYYEALCEQGPAEYEGRALAVVDGFGLPLYAAS